MSQERPRIAIVTGAARGIGAGVAVRLAADGMTVAGLQGLTKTLAKELGPYGITASAVAPGFIATDMTAATATRVKMSFEDFKTAAASQIPVRRVGLPEDVAHTVSFLVSDGAGYVSGQIIYVAGGPLC
jgi:3-oxoacyl-[acyl-carrier protein] reductase